MILNKTVCKELLPVVVVVVVGVAVTVPGTGVGLVADTVGTLIATDVGVNAVGTAVAAGAVVAVGAVVAADTTTVPIIKVCTLQ